MAFGCFWRLRLRSMLATASPAPLASFPCSSYVFFFFFFFNDTATTEIYTLSLHDALPICQGNAEWFGRIENSAGIGPALAGGGEFLSRNLIMQGPCHSVESSAQIYFTHPLVA